MDLDTFMITVFCCIDDILESLYQGRLLRQRGPKPALSDPEVLTIEVVGEYMGHSQDHAPILPYERKRRRTLYLASRQRSAVTCGANDEPPRIPGSGSKGR